jgi:hypothetical protein
MPTHSLSTVSRNWVRSALTDRTLFSDSPPRWKSQPSYPDACEEREARIRLFKKHGSSDLAVRLAQCCSSSPCLSGACPVCTRALQRHFVSQAYPILQPTHAHVTISLIPNIQANFGALARLPVTDITDLIERKLTKSRLRLCIGGIDFSFNEHRQGTIGPHWAPHIWLLASNYNQARWERLLRRHFQRTQSILRPVKIQDWDGDRSAIGYALKYKFGRRISGIGVRSQGTRTCKVTDYDRLRSKERFELYTGWVLVGGSY